MLGRIIGFFCCMLCALPFFYLAWEGRQKDAAPLAFWAGDDTLKTKVRNIPAYNAEMSRLYRYTALAFSAAALLCLLSPIAGIILVCIESTVGAFVLYRFYSRILKKYS